MIGKPVKRNRKAISVTYASKLSRIIDGYYFGQAEFSNIAGEFGSVSYEIDDYLQIGHPFRLIVSPQYDFAEVFEYLIGYEENDGFESLSII